ncbi:SDR family NAD(P)-dependent oxidoreductase [Pseudactinotalea sp. HY158]|uniref:SDR family NAD(P)-dependent oxidoreductase n=1 Tax=Pseudactinotalea sp. HY158 TaxID=2654547 RepID=UPI00129C7AC9|nr:SDR family NAD(P)-dependent oxidoreductase [Pseudactinotalea sp. HY158]QGH69937.1 SDR family NAD(P)-dependent oxidoreductase [Pseudactinotalea sp. HY158]
MNDTHAPDLVVVTGASSGIGEATVRHLRGLGTPVVAVARRRERLETLAGEVGCEVVAADLATAEGARALTDHVGARALAAVVANAGGARGVDPVEAAGGEEAEAVIGRWREMYDMNVVATLRTVTALLPALRAGGGDVVVVTSMAAREFYPGGAGYTAAKHAERAIPATLRMELLGEPIRIIEIAPGLVHTEEFSLRRLGDRARAEAVYAGVPGPLHAADVAEAIAWTLSRPAHVNIDLLEINPVAQAGATRVHRLTP